MTEGRLTVDGKTENVTFKVVYHEETGFLDLNDRARDYRFTPLEQKAAVQRLTAAGFTIDQMVAILGIYRSLVERYVARA